MCDTKGTGGCGRNRETGIDLYTPWVLRTEEISSESLLHSTGSSTQCSAVAWMGRQAKGGIRKRNSWLPLLGSGNGHSLLQRSGFCCVLGRSVVSDSVTPQPVAHQAPLSMGFSTQEYWSGLPFPTPGDLLDPGIKLGSLASPGLAGRFFTTH